MNIPQEASMITDEMVEAACVAYAAEWIADAARTGQPVEVIRQRASDSGQTRAAIRASLEVAIRAALEAAERVRPRPEGRPGIWETFHAFKEARDEWVNAYGGHISPAAELAGIRAILALFPAHSEELRDLSLPCEVTVAPCTRFGKGVKLGTVIDAILRRSGREALRKAVEEGAIMGTHNGHELAREELLKRGHLLLKAQEAAPDQPALLPTCLQWVEEVLLLLSAPVSEEDRP